MCDSLYKIKLDGIEIEDIRDINLVTKLGFLTDNLRKKLKEISRNYEKNIQIKHNTSINCEIEEVN